MTKAHLRWIPEHGDKIVHAWGEKCSGPGWSNQIVWVLIYNAQAGGHRLEAIQPQDQSEIMQYTHGISNETHNVMTNEVRRWANH